MDKYNKFVGPKGIGQNPVLIGQVDSQCFGGQLSTPTPPPSPIQQEFEELRDAIETLEKEHYNLADKLQPVIAIDHSESKKLEGAATEPQTGCLVKDKLADLKQRVLYIRRMTVDLKDRIWL